MALQIGYLLPTRERIMEDRPEAAPLLTLAERAEAVGLDSVWVGDSLLARPRHEPLTLLAAVAARTTRVSLGTAVLLPMLRNPVILAHTVATLDQISQGRVILGVGIARDVPSIRAEFVAAGVPFDKRVGRMMEGLRLCQALWRGEPVDWEGRWTVAGGVLGPTPHRPGGPPIWGGGSHRGGLTRAGRYFDGWFPTGPDAAGWATQWTQVQGFAREAGRDPAEITGAIYLTIAIDESAERAHAKIDNYFERYYSAPAATIRPRQANYGGPAEGLAEWLSGYADAGVSHMCVRVAGGEHERHQDALAEARAALRR